MLIPWNEIESHISEMDSIRLQQFEKEISRLIKDRKLDLDTERILYMTSLLELEISRLIKDRKLAKAIEERVKSGRILITLCSNCKGMGEVTGSCHDWEGLSCNCTDCRGTGRKYAASPAATEKDWKLLEKLGEAGPY